MGATATVEIDTDRDRDAQAIFEKSQEINKVNTLLHVYDVLYLVFWGFFKFNESFFFLSLMKYYLLVKMNF